MAVKACDFCGDVRMVNSGEPANMCQQCGHFGTLRVADDVTITVSRLGGPQAVRALLYVPGRKQQE